MCILVYVFSVGLL